MQNSGLNSNVDRKKFWEQLHREQTDLAISVALGSIQPVTAQVLIWRYRGFREISQLLHCSISTIRHHHSRGLFELQRFFAVRI